MAVNTTVSVVRLTAASGAEGGEMVKKERKQATPSTGYLDHHGIIYVTAFADYQDADTGRSGWFFSSFFAGLGRPFGVSASCFRSFRLRTCLR
jgi:hypothetical protein